jgi:glycogen debranching enzyme
VKSYETPSDPELIRGLPTKLSDIAPVVPNTGFDNGVSFSEINVPDFFPPGSIMVFETQMEGVSAELDTFLRDGLDDAVAGLELLDLNVVLYRADAEERDVTKGEIGAYNVPGLGNLVYCGLEGWMHPLRHIMKFNDLGHPLAAHIREGTWALDYIASRLIKYAPLINASLGDAYYIQTRGNFAQRA